MTVLSAPWALSRGATVLPDGSTRFEVWAPRRPEVTVRIGAGAARREVPLEPVGGGVHRAEAGARPGEDYFLVVGGEERPDPVSRFQPRGVHGPSRIVDPGAFPWNDGGWRGLAMDELVLYELHVGTFTPGGTFDDVVERLGWLRDHGVTAIEIMPVAEFPGGRNWGYDGAHPFAPQSTYGGPEGLRRLVDAAHGAGLGVVLDVVYNHLGPEGNYLAEYGPYFTDRYHTPWGRALNFDDADSDEVRRYFVDNALYWITEFHLDGLRLDAVHGIYDFTARHILAEIADAVHDQGARLGRRALVIAESDLNDARLVRPAERGGYGLDGQWSDDFHHAVHAALTGERAGYYVDFGGASTIARAFRDRFVLGGSYSRHRRRRHGAPCADVPADRFVVFVQNHDQVGNRARGDRLSTLVEPEALRLAAALLLLGPYVPLLFMGEEYGETKPFLYFVSHGDPDLVEAVREGRRREFESFGWDTAIPDPQAEETFEASRLDWERSRSPGGEAMLALVRQLLRLRREEPALRPGAATVEVLDDEETILLGFRSGSRELLGVFHLGAGPRSFPLPGGGAWEVLFSTHPSPPAAAGASPERTASPLALAPRSAILLRKAAVDA